MVNVIRTSVNEDSFCVWSRVFTGEVVFLKSLSLPLLRRLPSLSDFARYYVEKHECNPPK